MPRSDCQIWHGVNRDLKKCFYILRKDKNTTLIKEQQNKEHK